MVHMLESCHWTTVLVNHILYLALHSTCTHCICNHRREQQSCDWLISEVYVENGHLQLIVNFFYISFFFSQFIVFFNNRLRYLTNSHMVVHTVLYCTPLTTAASCWVRCCLWLQWKLWKLVGLLWVNIVCRWSDAVGWEWCWTVWEDCKLESWNGT